MYRIHLKKIKINVNCKPLKKLLEGRFTETSF